MLSVFLFSIQIIHVDHDCIINEATTSSQHQGFFFFFVQGRNRRVPFQLNNTKESIPLKDINKSQPQNNLNQFKEDNAQEYYDARSIKGVHCVAASVPNDPPMKPKDCVLETIAEVEIETKLSLSTPEDTKNPGSAMEVGGAWGNADPHRGSKGALLGS